MVMLVGFGFVSVHCKASFTNGLKSVFTYTIFGISKISKVSLCSVSALQVNIVAVLDSLQLLMLFVGT